MTKRYYICRVVKDDFPPYAWNSELRKYVQSHWGIKYLQQAIYPSVLMWVIMKYDLDLQQHLEVMSNVPQLFSFPELALDTQVRDVPADKRLAIRTKLENIGFDFDWVTLDNTIRDILTYVFHTIQVADWARVPIEAKNFDLHKPVSVIPAEKRLILKRKMEFLGVPTDWIELTDSVGDVVNRIMRRADDSPRLIGTRRPHQIFYVDEDEY